jgi:hypothetical protein
MWLIEWHPTLNATNHRVAPAGELLHEHSRLFVFVGFSDDRRLALVVRFGVVAFVLVIIIIIIIIVIVGVSRRHRVAHDGDESPLGAEKFSRMRWVMAGSLLDVATFMRGCYDAGPEPQPLVTGFGPLRTMALPQVFGATCGFADCRSWVTSTRFALRATRSHRA